MFPSLLVLAFCAALPASPEADMTPVLAPAVLVDETSLAGDTTTISDQGDIADTSSDSNGRLQYADLEPALVVDSIQ